MKSKINIKNLNIKLNKMRIKIKDLENTIYTWRQQNIKEIDSLQTKSLKQKPIGEVTPSVSINQGLEDKTADTNSSNKIKREE